MALSGVRRSPWVQLLGSLLVDHEGRVRWGRLDRLYQGSSSGEHIAGEAAAAAVDTAVLMAAVEDGLTCVCRVKCRSTVVFSFPVITL